MSLINGRTVPAPPPKPELPPFPQKTGRTLPPLKTEPPPLPYKAYAPPWPYVHHVESEDDKFKRTGGFKDLGHFAYALIQTAARNSDPTMVQALALYEACLERISRAATGMNEASEPDGASVVPPDHALQIWRRSEQYENLIDLLTTFRINGNEFKIPSDAESSRVDGSRSGGIQSFWSNEASQFTRSRPTFSDRYLRLKKMAALVYITRELSEDSSSLGAYLDLVAPDELAFQINSSLVNGDGVGMPLGLLNSNATISVDKESGQSAGTIVGLNLANMWSRFYAPCRRNAAWYVAGDAERQVQTAVIATGTGAGELLYKEPRGDSPYGTIYGRPVIPFEACSTVGTVGDIILLDPSQIVGIRKRTLNQSVSTHLRFDYDEVALKFIFRVDAQPLWISPLTPYRGTTTVSPIVTLATRS
jgi:HK97 family phage major capsid protein